MTIRNTWFPERRQIRTSYKGSAPRPADAALFARAREGRMQLPNTCKGGRKKRPMIWCEPRFDINKSCLCRANCPVVLSCAVCFCYRCCILIGSTGVLCVGEKTGGRERSNTREKREREKSSTQRHVLYPVLLYFPKEAHSAARHSTAAKGTAPHHTAPHGATLRCWAI